MSKKLNTIHNRLAWLSRNHYNSLLIVCNIRTALRHGIANTNLLTFIQEEFDRCLQPHFFEEEAWLFPQLPIENPLRIHVEKQLGELRRMVKSLGNYTELQSSLPEEFANALEEHIRFEERTLFPFIEKIINE